MLTKSQYERIKSEYGARRARALAIHDKKMSDLRIRYPEFSAMEDEASGIAMDYARRYVADPSVSLDEMDCKLKELTARKNEFLLSRGIDPESLKPDYHCPDCQDTGYVGSEKCHCFRQAELEITYNHSNLSSLLATNNFDNMREDLFEGEDRVRFKEAASQCRRFAADFDDKYENLMLTGTVGTGKSFLTCCIAAELLKTGHSVIYFSAVDFFKIYGNQMYGRRYGDEDADVSDDDIYTCDLLIIDDLGSESVNDQFSGSALFNCMNSRHNAQKSTIINTNLSLSYLHERYTDRVFSRLTGYYRILKLTGPDLRIRYPHVRQS